MFQSILLFVLQHPVWTGLIIGGTIVGLVFAKLFLPSLLFKK